MTIPCGVYNANTAAANARPHRNSRPNEMLAIRVAFDMARLASSEFPNSMQARYVIADEIPMKPGRWGTLLLAEGQLGYFTTAQVQGRAASSASSATSSTQGLRGVYREMRPPGQHQGASKA
jgi:hypothetical protein